MAGRAYCIEPNPYDIAVQPLMAYLFLLYGFLFCAFMERFAEGDLAVLFMDSLTHD